MVVRQYRAKGPLTSTLLPVVAMDDAVGLIVFAISLALARTFANGSALTVKNMLIDPVVEIVLSLTIGGVIGLLLAVGIRFFHSRANRLMLCLTAVLLGIALAELMSLSSLLLCMMIGAVYCNLGADTAVVMDLCDRWTPPVLLLFFVVSGAELELSVIPTVGLLGIIYMAHAFAGQVFWRVYRLAHYACGCEHPQVSGHYAAATGWRSHRYGAAGHCAAAAVRRADSRGGAVRHADLRAGRPLPDQEGAAGGRGNRSQERLKRS